ncbi:MAG: hypothetical protein KQJ78_11135 [Deltaproteobacteria bacterium]|nr:hypothetical protein [Deltaproteobacteria bacterium]
MRFHRGGEEPRDALARVYNVLSFLELAVRGMDTDMMTEEDAQGLVEVLVACRDAVRDVDHQLEEPRHRAA